MALLQIGGTSVDVTDEAAILAGDVESSYLVLWCDRLLTPVFAFRR